MRWSLILLFAVGTAHAEVYRCERGGQVIYTDQPCSESAQPKDLPRLQVVEPNEFEQRLAGEYDKKQARDKKARDKANKEWLVRHKANTLNSERLQKARKQGKVAAGMSAEQVRNLYGEPDDIKITGRENGATERWTFHRHGAVQTVDLKDGLVTRHTEKKSKKK